MIRQEMSLEKICAFYTLLTTIIISKPVCDTGFESPYDIAIDCNLFDIANHCNH